MDKRISELEEAIRPQESDKILISRGETGALKSMYITAGNLSSVLKPSNDPDLVSISKSQTITGKKIFNGILSSSSNGGILHTGIALLTKNPLPNKELDFYYLRTTGDVTKRNDCSLTLGIGDDARVGLQMLSDRITIGSRPADPDTAGFSRTISAFVYSPIGTITQLSNSSLIVNTAWSYGLIYKPLYEKIERDVSYASSGISREMLDVISDISDDIDDILEQLNGVKFVRSILSIYVKPTGNNSNNGLTEETAVKTIGSAFNKIRGYRSIGNVSYDIILDNNAVYDFTSDLTGTQLWNISHPDCIYGRSVWKIHPKTNDIDHRCTLVFNNESTTYVGRLLTLGYGRIDNCIISGNSTHDYTASTNPDNMVDGIYSAYGSHIQLSNVEFYNLYRGVDANGSTYTALFNPVFNNCYQSVVSEVNSRVNLYGDITLSSCYSGIRSLYNSEAYIVPFKDRENHYKVSVKDKMYYSLYNSTVGSFISDTDFKSILENGNICVDYISAGTNPFVYTTKGGLYGISDKFIEALSSANVHTS